MALSEQEEFELLSLEREKSMQQPSVDKPSEKASMGSYLWDEAKKGFAGSLALPGQGAQAMIPQPLRGAAATIGNALPDVVGNLLKPTDYGEQTQKLVGVENLPTPTNEYGKPSKANEYLGKIAQFAGASAIPSVGVISAAERPLIASCFL